MKINKKCQIWKNTMWRISIILFFLIGTLFNHSSELKKTDCLKLSGIEFIFIPAGEFIMGSNEGEPDEKPVHKTNVDGFYMSKHEVTFMQYDLFCEKTGRKKPSDALYARCNWKKMGMNASEDEQKSGRGNLPVINVSWHDAKAYCFWLSKKTGKQIRLPYESEWEYACRAGKTEAHYNNINSIAWHKGNSTGRTHPVMEKQANAFGLYDMLGNVWEWCEDWYDPLFYSKESRDIPRAPNRGTSRVVRGGSWINKPEVCTAHRRRGCHPQKSGSGLGFRLVIEIKK